jgi:hypothetical protein
MTLNVKVKVIQGQILPIYAKASGFNGESCFICAMTFRVNLKVTHQ